jgi:protein-disulfide isomerase
VKISHFLKMSLLGTLAISSASMAADKVATAPAAATQPAPAAAAVKVTATATPAAPAAAAPTKLAANTTPAAPPPPAAPAPAAPAPAVPITSFNASQVQQLQQIIHDYLVKNPQVLVEASEVLQKQAMVKVEETAKAAAITNSDKLFADPNSPVSANAKGTVSLVAFFDYQCPHCKDMEPILEKVTAANKNLRIVYKELPIFGDNSKFATTAALASIKQGPDKYLKFHNALMASPNPLTNDKVLEIAKTVGLNIDQLKKDMDSGSAAYKKQIEDNYNLAQTIGIIGTPSYIVATWLPLTAPRNVTFVPGLTTEENIQKAITQASK